MCIRDRRLCEQVSSIPDRLPDTLIHSDYTIHETITLVSFDECYQRTLRKPELLRSLNLNFVIPHITPSRCRDETNLDMDFLLNSDAFARFICAGLDMAQCSLSLECDADLKLKITAYESDALELIDHHRMRFTERCFSGFRQPIQLQLFRVQEDFSWGKVTSKFREVIRQGDVVRCY